MPYSKYIGITVGITLLSSLGAEIYAFLPISTSGFLQVSVLGIDT